MAITREYCDQYWASLGDNIPQNSSCTATYHQSQKPIKVRRTRHAGHCWRSMDELITDIILWTSSHGQAKAGWPARTYIQQLCADTGYYLENLPGAMDDRDGWRERAREICASSATWWWWYIYIYIYIYIYLCHPQTDFFVVSQLFSVARHVGRLKPRLKPS